MNRTAPILVSCALTLLLVLPSLPGRAADSPSGWAYDLADELMSPFCPGLALSQCPSPQATDLRRWIVEQAEAGASREAVEAELFSVWGDQLRQAPRAEGVGLVAYAIPAVAFAVGGALVFLFLRRQRGAREAVAATPRLAPVDPELERQVDEELGRP